jgi:hypothetical protein
MNKVITIVVDELMAKQIFDEYYEFAEFISMETEAEYDMTADGWATWDGEKPGFDDDDDDDDDCDCEDDCTCDNDDDAHRWVDRRKVEI